MSLALQEPIDWHELRAESFTQAHLIDKISVPGRAKSAQGRKVGAQTPTTIIHNLSHRVPHPKDRGVMLQKNTPKKAEMPAQLFLIMVAICSTKELLVVPKTPSNSEPHWSIQVLIYIPRRMQKLHVEYQVSLSTENQLARKKSGSENANVTPRIQKDLIYPSVVINPKVFRHKNAVYWYKNFKRTRIILF